MKKKSSSGDFLTGFERIDPAKSSKPVKPSKSTVRNTLVGDEDLYPTTPAPEDPLDWDIDTDEAWGFGSFNDFGDS